MDAPSTENQGIQPDPLYACGWSFQDRVEVHTKAKQAFSTLPWMHYQQRIREFNRTRCTRVVDCSKIVLRYTPKPNKPSASCHGCTRCLEKRQWNLSETANCEIKCVIVHYAGEQTESPNNILRERPLAKIWALLTKFSEELPRQESKEESLNVQCGRRQAETVVRDSLSTRCIIAVL